MGIYFIFTTDVKGAITVKGLVDNFLVIIMRANNIVELLQKVRAEITSRRSKINIVDKEIKKSYLMCLRYYERLEQEIYNRYST